ncbi:MAG: glycosyltransferase family 9 protein, partial [Candidatus Rokuibacteriota bacterium]
DLVWRHLLSSIGDTKPGDGAPDVWPVTVPAALVDEGRRALGAAGWDIATPLLMVHPGAGGAAKRWPPAGFAAALAAVRRQATVDVVIHQGPADAAAVVALRSQLTTPVLTLVEPSLPALAGALRCVRGLVGNDSGVSHLAAAVAAPSLVLCTPPMLPWRPWSPRARVVTVSTTALATRDVEAVTRELRSLLR